MALHIESHFPGGSYVIEKTMDFGCRQEMGGTGLAVDAPRCDRVVTLGRDLRW
jgi:hypothetical protein